jgi:hypothetical protein
MEQAPAIDLPFTTDAVVLVLSYGASQECSPYSQVQIAEWCDRFWCHYLDVIAAPAIEAVLPILAEVDEQLSEHQQIPPELFRQWVNLAKAKLLRVSEN